MRMASMGDRSEGLADSARVSSLSLRRTRAKNLPIPSRCSTEEGSPRALSAESEAVAGEATAGPLEVAAEDAAALPALVAEDEPPEGASWLLGGRVHSRSAEVDFDVSARLRRWVLKVP
jgi:hypothetical protein